MTAPTAIWNFWVRDQNRATDVATANPQPTVPGQGRAYTSAETSAAAIRFLTPRATVGTPNMIIFGDM